MPDPAQQHETAPVKNKGGRPKGIPRETSTTVRIFATVKKETAEKLERIAKQNGFERKPASKRPFFGGAIDKLAEAVKTAEPEYLRLAREAQVRPTRA